jgi:hypothetical protein
VSARERGSKIGLTQTKVAPLASRRAGANVVTREALNDRA